MPDPDNALDDYKLEHEREHSRLTDELRAHEHLPSHGTIEVRVRALEDFKLQTSTIVTLLKVIFGASILAAVTGVISLITLIEHLGG